MVQSKAHLGTHLTGLAGRLDVCALSAMGMAVAVIIKRGEIVP